jgi:cation diffusion facilitator family transporter
MMIAEIAGGWWFNSMALLADGWHMSSHALAIGLSATAYTLARKFAHDRRFSFGTWKIEVLGGYTSAIILIAVALLMLYQSIERLISPSHIHYDQAIAIAFIGLIVNLYSAWLLKDGHIHEHSGDNSHHHDLNLRSAFIHVVADAATSVLAIVALLCGKFWGASWLDPVMGIAGAVLILFWAYGLLRDSGRVLLDVEMNPSLVAEVKNLIESSFVQVFIRDIHVWRVGKGKYACILSLKTETNVDPMHIRRLLSDHESLLQLFFAAKRPGSAGALAGDNCEYCHHSKCFACIVAPMLIRFICSRCRRGRRRSRAASRLFSLRFFS